MYITERRLLKWALYSNAIYIAMLVLFKPDGINFQKAAITCFLLFSALSIGYICIRNRKRLKEVPKTTRGILYLLLLWGGITVVRSFSYSIQDWVTNFGNVHMALAWATPIVMIVGQKIENWAVIFQAINFMFVLIIIAFILQLMGLGSIAQEWTWLLRPINFIFLLSIYAFKYINKATMLIVLFLYVFIAIKVRLRIEFLFLFLVFFFIGMDKLFSMTIKRVFLKYILLGFILIIILIFTIGYEQVSLLVSSLIEFQDSRTFLFKEMLDGMNLNEKIFGRGSLGTYYSDFFERTRRYYLLHPNFAWAGDVPNRITTEVGYLQMILKGGLILLVLNVSMSVYAIYLALFKSNNRFIKRLGYFILILCILSLVSFRPAFTPTFIIFWIAIGTVLNKKYRMMMNDEIDKIIRF